MALATAGRLRGRLERRRHWRVTYLVVVLQPAGDLRAPPTQSREHSLTDTDGTRTRLTGQPTATAAQTKLLVTKCVKNFQMKSSF